MDSVIAKGPRATKLGEILETSVKQTMRACSYEKLVSCFPTLAHTDPGTVRHAQEQVSLFLTTACKSEFEKILNERRAVQRLNELDDLISDAKRRKEKGQVGGNNPSDLNPDTILKAHVLPLDRAELTRLNIMIQRLQLQNAANLSILEEQRQQAESQTRILTESLSTLASLGRI